MEKLSKEQFHKTPVFPPFYNVKSHTACDMVNPTTPHYGNRPWTMTLRIKRNACISFRYNGQFERYVVNTMVNTMVNPCYCAARAVGRNHSVIHWYGQYNGMWYGQSKHLMGLSKRSSDGLRLSAWSIILANQTWGVSDTLKTKINFKINFIIRKIW